MLLTIFLLLSLGAAALTAWGASLMLWWLPLLFVGYFVGLCAVLMLYLLFMAAITPEEGVREKDDRFFRGVFDLVLPFFFFFAGARIKVTGREKMEQAIKDGRFLLVCNHLSTFDALVAVSVFPKARLAYISKPENFDMPIFGRLIRRLCFMPIDRERPRHALDTVNHAVSLLERDEVSVAVFPEGTRNRAEVGLLPYHEGVFLIAEKARAPIVVMTLTNCQKICRNFPWRRTAIHMDIAAVISAEQVDHMRCHSLSEMVRGVMTESLLKNGYPFAPEAEGEETEVKEDAVVS